MLNGVVDDVSSGFPLAIGQPKVTSLLTLITLGLPTSVRSNTHQQRRPTHLLCIYR